MACDFLCVKMHLFVKSKNKTSIDQSLFIPDKKSEAQVNENNWLSSPFTVEKYHSMERMVK